MVRSRRLASPFVVFGFALFLIVKILLSQLVELKNGETYNGHLVNCDTWMNIHLREVICTSKVKSRALHIHVVIGFSEHKIN